MKKHLLKVLSLHALLIATLLGVVAQTTTINVNLNQKHQTIEGIGSFMPTQGPGGWPDLSELQAMATETIAQDPSVIRLGAELEHLSLMEPVNDNADPNVLDMTAFDMIPANTALYQQYAGTDIEKFILTVWSPPGWMKSHASYAWHDQNQWQCPNVDKLCGGFLMPTMYEEFGEWVTGVILRIEQELGDGAIYAVSPQNEPEFPEPYGSCVYSPETLRDATKALYHRLQAEGLNTRIYVGEALHPQGNILNFYNAIFNDSIANEAVHAMAYHDYLADGVGAGNTDASNLLVYGNAAKNANKSHWMTETSGYVDGVRLARQMFKGFYYANISLWTYFGNRESEGEPYYTNKAFMQFVRPGAIRVGTDTIPIIGGSNPSEDGILPLAFINPTDNSYTIIAINQDLVSRNIIVNYEGGSGPEQMDVYITSPIHNNEMAGITAKGSQYFTNIPPSGMAVLYGVGSSDDEAPTKPDSLYTTIVIDTVVVLNFNASTDNVGIEEYEIYADGVLIDVSPGFTTYAIRGLESNTTYSFTVVAVDAAGNKSVASDPLIVVTEPSATGGTNPTATTDPSTGSTNTTDPTVTSVSSENVDVSVSPNPVSDILNINNSERTVLVTINDALGNTRLVTKSKSIDISGLPNGVYYVAIEVEGQKTIERVLVSH